MYDVSSRTIIIKSATGKDVGPSTYVTCNPRSKTQNFAPFLSTQPKDSILITRLNTDAIYNTGLYRDKKIRGGSSLRNKAPRFVYKGEDTPGPTTYEAKPIRWVKKKLKLDPTKPKLYQCRVPYAPTVVAPTIPTKIDENGYEIDDDGNLIKMPPDEKIPIDITIKSQFCHGRGWRWSCRSSTRFEDNRYHTYGPGPAAYFRKIPKCRRAEEDERFREMARLLSFVPRFVEAQEMKAAREKLPGPGTYTIFSKNPDSPRSKSINPKPFINGAERFSYQHSDTPSPAQYCVCDCSRKKKQFSRKPTPFGFECPRFSRKKIECTPGPGDYEIKGALQEKMEKKRNPLALCHSPFNSTAQRKLSFVARDAPCVPSPADYPEDKEIDDPTKEISSSVFMNIVCRFSSPSDKKDFVGPAKYDVSSSFDKNHSRKCFGVGDVPFNTSGPRSTTPAVRLDLLCPTTYKNERGLSDKSYFFNVTPRFSCPEDTPGPGDYKIHPCYERSFYRTNDTHNLKLKENVLKKKLRTAPRDTRKKWIATLKKNKLLKWFNVELDYEERMILLIQELFDKPI